MFTEATPKSAVFQNKMISPLNTFFLCNARDPPCIRGKKGNSPDSNKDHMQCKWFNLVCTVQETVKGFSVLAEFCKLKKVKIYKQKKKEKQI